MPWQTQTYICSSSVCHRFLLAKCSKEGKMSKKCKVNWSDIDGASPKPKRLHLEKDETDSLYHCPIQECDHDGFQSQRGCRKHVNTKHSWFFYFDEKPTDSAKLATNSSEIPKKSSTSDTDGDISHASTNPGARLIPSFSPSGQIGDEFTNWLTGSGGGYKKGRPAQQIINRCFKFLTFCCDSLIRKRSRLLESMDLSP